MREKFKILSQYIAEMRDGINMNKERLRTVSVGISVCKELRNATNRETKILEIAEEWWKQRTAELESKSSFLTVPEEASYKNEFNRLRELIDEMKKPINIPEKRMREIWLHIEVCNHLKESAWQIGLFKTAQTLWLDIMREKQEKARQKIQKERIVMHSTRKSLQFSKNDKKFLKSLRVSIQDPPEKNGLSESECKALMKMERPKNTEFNAEDEEFLRKVSRNEIGEGNCD